MKIFATLQEDKIEERAKRFFLILFLSARHGYFHNPSCRLHVQVGRVRYLTDEEFDRLFNACPDYLKPIVMTARHTGLRKENILSLTWSRVDLFRRLLTIEHTKNNERLSVPLNETLMNLFVQLSKVRHINSPYVFCKADGSKYHNSLNGFWKAVKKTGITDFKFHDLRHCFASALVQRGVDLYQVQRLLGHKSNAMTQRYAHLSSEN